MEWRKKKRLHASKNETKNKTLESGAAETLAVFLPFFLPPADGGGGAFFGDVGLTVFTLMRSTWVDSETLSESSVFTKFGCLSTSRGI